MYQDNITKDGIALSGLAKHTAFFKTEVKTSVLNLADNSKGVVTESTSDKKHILVFCYSKI